MVEALRRDTLKWEKITLNGKKYSNPYYYDDGTRINFENTLAIRGKFNARGYVRCSDCGRVFTRKAFEKHHQPVANEKICISCSCHGIKDPQIIKHKNNNWCIKGNITCEFGYDCKYITKDFVCKRYVCSGSSRKIAADAEWSKPSIPSQILTIAAVKNWRCIECSDNLFYFEYRRDDLRLPYIGAIFDKNGYLIKICIDSHDGYFDKESDNYIRFDGRVINVSADVKTILRGVYA